MPKRKLKIDELAESMLNPQGYKGLARFHKYWGKKPIECWNYLIHQLTEPDDLIIDPFLGSGLIAREVINSNRRFIGIDINPISIELTKLYMKLPSADRFDSAVKSIEMSVKPIIDDTYKLPDNKIASHYLWKQDTLIQIWRKADRKGKKRIEYEPTDFDTQNFNDYENYVSKYISAIDFFHNSRINTKSDLTIEDLFTGRALNNIDILYDAILKCPEELHRALLLTLTSAIGQMSKMVFAVTRRGKRDGKIAGRTEVGSWVVGYWRPKLHFEINVWNCYLNKADVLLRALRSFNDNGHITYAKTSMHVIEKKSKLSLVNDDANCALSKLPESSVNLFLTDPPHGDRIPYLELSNLWNTLLDKPANYDDEIVISNARERGKTAVEYNADMRSFFSECERLLVDGGCIALMFNTRNRKHRTGLEVLEGSSSEFKYVGCFPMNYSAGSVAQDNRNGALKCDYVLIYCKAGNDSSYTDILKKFDKLPAWQTSYPGSKN